MKQTVNFREFTDAFQAIRPDNFSYEGLRALFEYLEDFEEDTGDELELDVIALCCNFSEYSSAIEAAEEYGIEPLARNEKEALNYLLERAIVIPFKSGIIAGFF